MVSLGIYAVCLLYGMKKERGYVMLTEIIGMFATITSILSLVPQIIKTSKTKSVHDLSFLMVLNLLCTSVLWFIYGLMIESLSVIVANVILTIFSVWLLYLKVIYD